MTAIALALIPCVMVQFILQERECQLKHQQLLSGMSLAGYWGSNVIFDMIMAYIPVLLIILLTFLFAHLHIIHLSRKFYITLLVAIVLAIVK